MTDQRTLKKIIAEQREKIEKQKIIIDELNDNYLKLNLKYQIEKLQDAILAFEDCKECTGKGYKKMWRSS